MTSLLTTHTACPYCGTVYDEAHPAFVLDKTYWDLTAIRPLVTRSCKHCGKTFELDIALLTKDDKWVFWGQPYSQPFRDCHELVGDRGWVSKWWDCPRCRTTFSLGFAPPPWPTHIVCPECRESSQIPWPSSPTITWTCHGCHGQQAAPAPALKDNHIGAVVDMTGTTRAMVSSSVHCRRCGYRFGERPWWSSPQVDSSLDISLAMAEAAFDKL